MPKRRVAVRFHNVHDSFMSIIKLLKLWENLRSGFWFIPAFIACGGVALAVICPWVDGVLPGFGQWIGRQGYLIDAGGSRTILSVIASSAITVAGVVFSITMVVLATMSAQFGPRLLPNFMRQNSTKFVLGGFIGTFVYCMLGLSQLTGDGEHGDIPKITVLVGLLLGILSFGLLIFFIHQVARFIQAPCILQDVAHRLRLNILRYFPESEDKDSSADVARDVAPPTFNDQATGVSLMIDGYLQVIDLDALLEWSVESNATLHIVKRPGDFVVADEKVVWIRSETSLPEVEMETVRDAFIVGVDRTDTQDVHFAVDQLVEVAVRALSPGVNDPYTAVNCIDHLRAALALMSTRCPAASARRDGDGKVRIRFKTYTFSGILDLAFHPLRQHGKSLESVAIRLMETMVSLADRKLPDSFRDALGRHARLLREDVQESFAQKLDRKDFERRYRRFQDLMGEE